MGRAVVSRSLRFEPVSYLVQLLRLNESALANGRAEMGNYQKQIHVIAGRNIIVLALITMSAMVAQSAHAVSPIFDDQFDDGILDPEWEVVFPDTGSQANDWIRDESVTQPSWLTVEDIFSPAMHTNTWRIVQLIRPVPATTDFHVKAGISWDSVQPPNYPGNQKEASQGLFVRLIDEEGNAVAIAGYRDNWGLHSADRWMWTPAGTSGDRPGELPLAGSGTFDVTRVGDVFAFLWNGVSLFTTTSVTTEVSEVRLEIRTFDPSLDRFTPRSYMGTLSIDFLEFSGTTVLDAVKPTAVAGSNQAIHSGQVINLDGSGSFDDTTASINLKYSWSISSSPPNSTTALVGANSVNPSFLADLPGTFELELIVEDEAGNVSDPSVVSVSSENAAPQANAGDDQIIIISDTAFFDGTASSDADNDLLSYSWTVLSAPVGSSATLIGSTSDAPTLTPDLAGLFEIELVVSDGFDVSAPDSVTLTAITGEDFAEMELMDANDAVSNLLATSLDAIGHQNSLTNLISQVISSIQQDNISQAINKLDDIIKRTDGCAINGVPDAAGQEKDWVVSCAAQDEIYPLLLRAKAALESL